MHVDTTLQKARVRARSQMASTKNPSVDQYIRYVGHLKTGDFRHGVMRRRGGGLLAIWRVKGIASELFSDRDHIDARNRLNQRVASMHGGRRLLAVHEVKTYADEDEYPAGECVSAFAREVDERYRNGLFGIDDGLPKSRVYREGGRMMRLDLYVSAYLRPAPAPGSKFGTQKVRDWRRRWAEWRERKTARKRLDAERLREMETFAGQVESNLAEYRLERCGIRENAETGALYSEMYEALHHILYNERQEIGLTRGWASRAIYTQRIIAPADTVQICRAGGDRFGRLFTNRHYSVSAKPKAYRQITASTYPYTMTNVLAYWETRDAHDRMTLRRNQFLVSGDPAIGQERKLIRAAERLQDQEFAAGAHHFSFACYAGDSGGTHKDDPSRLLGINKVADKAFADLQNAGLHPFKEDLTLEAAVYAQLPDNEDLQPCPALANTLNFASWVRFYNYATGLKNGHWGPALIKLLTRGWTGYDFHLHAAKAIDAEGDLGNTLIVGPAGSGKTVLLAMIACMAEKFGADVVIYDKDRGLEILVRFLGGEYLRIPVGRPTGMNPLKGCAADDLEFLVQWYLGLRKHSRQDEPSEDQVHRLRLGLSELLAEPPEHRSNRELRAYLGEEGGWLDLWIYEGDRPGPYGWAFDGPEDKIMQRHRVTGRDMTAILDHPAACAPAVAYMLHSDKKRLDGKRKLAVLLDEVWKALLVEAFRAQINDLLKTIRKLQGAVVLGTQSIADILASAIAHTVMEQCPTRVWMANPRARETDHYDAGLTEPMWRAIREGAVVDHAFLVEQQVDQVLARMPLPPDIVAVMSGTSPRIELMDRLMAQHGEAIEAWGPHYRRLWHTAKTANA